MILIRANTERQIPVIRATLVSAPPSECLEIRLCYARSYICWTQRHMFPGTHPLKVSCQVHLTSYVDKLLNFHDMDALFISNIIVH